MSALFGLGVYKQIYQSILYPRIRAVFLPNRCKIRQKIRQFYQRPSAMWFCSYVIRITNYRIRRSFPTIPCTSGMTKPPLWIPNMTLCLSRCLMVSSIKETQNNTGKETLPWLGNIITFKLEWWQLFVIIVHAFLSILSVLAADFCCQFIATPLSCSQCAIPLTSTDSRWRGPTIIV